MGRPVHVIQTFIIELGICRGISLCYLLIRDTMIEIVVGLAIDKNGVLYVADGANIRSVNATGHISTVIGSQGPLQYWQPFNCDAILSATEVSTGPNNNRCSTNYVWIYTQRGIQNCTRPAHTLIASDRPT